MLFRKFPAVRILSLLLFLSLSNGILTAQDFNNDEINRWEKRAQKVTIVRDLHGIPHIYGDKDEDVVFGLMYAQCEDDFKRIEMNYIEKLGRMAEVKGEDWLNEDLLIRLVIDSVDAINDYHSAPKWLKRLCDAFADGMNYYLYKNPDEKPTLLQRFEPWYPFLWTDGSIGAINTAGIYSSELGIFYADKSPLSAVNENILKPAGFKEQLDGSNGFAFAPSITKSGNSILYINPHVTMYFRPEVHVVSKQGLNAYGAVTWGQFFVYQGFNEHCGWMHTSSYVDAADLYEEEIIQGGDGYYYLYDDQYLKVEEKQIQLSWKTDNGIQSKAITAYFTHHGPIMTRRDGKLLSMRSDNRLAEGLVQCWKRTKAKGLSSFKKTLELKGNISNNTVYADKKGNIGYWHGNRIPIRDIRYDWSAPIDGTVKDTEWKGNHPVKDIVQSINPPNGWLQNCNSSPYTCAGMYSPKRSDYPFYMAPDGENFRGINAVRTLSETLNYDLDKVIEAGYDTRLAAFELLIPALISAYDANINSYKNDKDLSQAIDILRLWDYKCAESSVATTLAVTLGENLLPSIYAVDVKDEYGVSDIVHKVIYFVLNADNKQWISALKDAMSQLKKLYGTWQVEWGAINRFQRISTDIDYHFDDKLSSIPVGFTSSLWGTLPAFSSKRFPNTNNRYGTGGNSFVCAVEFGKKVKAKALLAGGQSGHEESPHFFDQSEDYAKGKFRDVLFYKEDVMKNAKSIKHPGE